ncbi:Cytochrome P450 3A6 [Porphyridium purpureum]|uniref:Cytochrome P450 3A6 n=1 Tax=Porphyridium purpureum TaxID=35688 RepID=A0A5J4Z1B3_PORPP|nr:Cytochrome P450 3A6 [Porphyridium purpureum]|eukprot:POR2270..scf208_2
MSDRYMFVGNSYGHGRLVNAGHALGRAQVCVDRATRAVPYAAGRGCGVVCSSSLEQQVPTKPTVELEKFAVDTTINVFHVLSFVKDNYAWFKQMAARFGDEAGVFVSLKSLNAQDFLILFDLAMYYQITTGPNRASYPDRMPGAFIREYVQKNAPLGRGLVFSRGEYWSEHRKIAASVFRTGIVENSLPNSIDKKLDQLLRHMEANGKLNGDRIDTFDVFQRIALDAVGEVALGWDFDACGEGDKYADFMHEMLGATWTLEVLGLPIYRLPFKVGPVKTYEVARAKCLDIILSLMEEEKKRIRAGEGPSTSYLSRLLEAGQSNAFLFDDEAVVADCMDLMIAGHDTTANSLVAAAHLIATHTDIAEKLTAEVADVMQGRCNVSFQDVQKMTYLDCFVKESLRLYPAASLTSRLSVKDEVLVGIDGKRYFLPKGKMITMPNILYATSAKYWSEPFVVRPERFAPGGEYERMPLKAWVPFGAGPHVCIGQHFALLEMKLILAGILARGCRFTDPQVPDLDPVFGITVSFPKGKFMRVVR